MDAVHAGDEDMLATYTGYPTSEYLRVEGQDLATFNVFLERADQLAPYLRHLQRVSEDRPLVLTELGLAAEVHGDAEQARSLEMQLALVDASGCAGATVFSWTDEWAVGHGTGPRVGLRPDPAGPQPAALARGGVPLGPARAGRGPSVLAGADGRGLCLQRGAAARGSAWTPSPG